VAAHGKHKNLHYSWAATRAAPTFSAILPWKPTRGLPISPTLSYNIT